MLPSKVSNCGNNENRNRAHYATKFQYSLHSAVHYQTTGLEGLYQVRLDTAVPYFIRAQIKLADRWQITVDQRIFSFTRITSAPQNGKKARAFTDLSGLRPHHSSIGVREKS